MVRVADLLQVGEAEEFDVVLTEAAIGNRRADGGHLQALAGLVELQVKVLAALEVGPRDQVEALAAPGAGKIGQQAEVLKDGGIVGGDSDGRYSFQVHSFLSLIRRS